MAGSSDPIASDYPHPLFGNVNGLPPQPVLQPQRVPSISDSLLRDHLRLSVSSSGRKASLAFPHSPTAEPGVAILISAQDRRTSTAVPGIVEEGSYLDELNVSGDQISSNGHPRKERDGQVSNGIRAHNGWDRERSLHQDGVREVDRSQGKINPQTPMVNDRDGSKQLPRNDRVSQIAIKNAWNHSPSDRPRRISSLPQLGFTQQMLPSRLAHPPTWTPKARKPTPLYSSSPLGYDGSGEIPSPETMREPGQLTLLSLDKDRPLRASTATEISFQIPPERGNEIGRGQVRTLRNIETDVQPTGDGITAGLRLRVAPSWSRYPSHTKHCRSSSAGITDNVLVRDFATDPAAAAAAAGAAAATGRGDGGVRVGSVSATSKGSGQGSAPHPAYHHRDHHLRRSSLFKSGQVSIRRTILDRIGRMYRTQSTDYRLPDSGHRSSIATGGGLEHPELEIPAAISPFMPSLLSQSSSSSLPSPGIHPVDQKKHDHESKDGSGNESEDSGVTELICTPAPSICSHGKESSRN